MPREGGSRPRARRGRHSSVLPPTGVKRWREEERHHGAAFKDIKVPQLNFHTVKKHKIAQPCHTELLHKRQNEERKCLSNHIKQAATSAAVSRFLF